MNFNFKTNTKNQEKYYGTYKVPDEISKNIAIDLGCNMGFFVADNHNKFKKIYAIDASYQNFVETLKRVIALNLRNNTAYNVFCFNLAAAKNNNEVIKIYRHDHNGQSVSPMTVKEMFTAQYSNWDESKENFHNVHTISLEGMYEFFNIDYIDYLKMDIEGAEYEFLLDKDLSRIGCLALEIHGTLGQEMKDRLKAHVEKYFDVYDIDYDLPAPRHSEITYINKSYNYTK